MVFCITRGQDKGIAVKEILTCFTCTGIKALYSEFLILRFHLHSMYLTDCHNRSERISPNRLRPKTDRLIKFERAIFWK